MCVMCENGDDRTAFMEQVATQVAEHGVTYIPIEDGRFIYTVGMTGLGMPELVVDERSGAPLCGDHKRNTEGMHTFLEPIVEWARHIGSISVYARLRASDFIDEPMPYEVGFAPADPARLRAARSLYGDQVKALRPVRMLTKATS